VDLLGVESTIERILECSESVKEGVRNTPLYGYFHQGTEFTYIRSIDRDSNLHRFIVDNKPVLDVNVLNNELEYMINGIIVNHKLDISEEWHFQLSTIETLISYDHIQMVKNILNIIE
jgi:anti-sigma regulatory factor (Ser/Thr protein kinase)